MREKRESPTVDMCYHRGIDKGGPCPKPPQWKLKGEKHRFKVCDDHLAWGIRLSGIPAIVDKYDPDQNKKPEKIKVVEVDARPSKEEDSTTPIKILVKKTLK